jgi:hypothetical protein
MYKEFALTKTQTGMLKRMVNEEIQRVRRMKTDTGLLKPAEKAAWLAELDEIMVKFKSDGES